MTTDRRHFLALGGLGVVSVVAGTDHSAVPSRVGQRWTVPSDARRHRRTWMAWPDSHAIWGRALAGVQHDVALVARTIAGYEPVVVCANPGAAGHARVLCGPTVRVITSIPVDDCWMRDTGPVFRISSRGQVGAVGLGFNGWGGRQTARHDGQVARAVARRLDLPWVRAGFVGEGGAIETDGRGTVMATLSSLVNPNRNPGMSAAQVERAVLDAYGATAMLWLPGIRGRDITDDHVDATSRFIRPGVVMVQVPPKQRTGIWARNARRQFHVLSRAHDASGRGLTVIPMAGPRTVRSSSPDFVDSYVNFAVVNGAVVTAQFGDRDRDRACRATLSRAFPGRVVVQLDVDRLLAGGGGIHCITQHEPAAPR